MPGRRKKKLTVVLAWVFGLLLVILHTDFWRAGSVELRFGWLPDELLYRLVWMLLAWGYLLFFCARVWDDQER